MSNRLMKPLSIFKDVPLEDVQLPVWASSKLDGIRSSVSCGVALSNSGTPIASELCQALISDFNRLDGEFIYGDPTAPDCYNKTQSAVNSRVFPSDLDPSELRFYVFDYRLPDLKWSERLAYLERLFATTFQGLPHLVLVQQTKLTQLSEIEKFYNMQLELGFEGAIFKQDVHYKEGRSGKTKQCMLRLKPFGNEFFEAKIVGYECAYHNANEAETDNLGYTKRSSHASGKIPMDMLGAFIVVDCKSGIEFRLPASAMRHDERIRLWKNIDDYLGKYVRYTCMTYGQKVKPRMPSFRGFRSTQDFSPTGEF
ncbi:MAG: DNA ligase [Siphoviridae sp. ct7UA22]|nr:MAG: DNA ligase [Siphoviridae sp. ct7UA22]